MNQILTGGCQCGRVRFRIDGPLRRSTVCHCRMCQKATGGPFGAYASFATASVAWTRGQRGAFQSSASILRGFCRDCGTPLTFEVQGGESIGITIGAFDDPAAVAPHRQIELGLCLPWAMCVAELPGRSPEDEAAMAGRYPPVVSRQHPDHDTQTWSR